mgnify:CR=1 FL=1
MPMSQAETTSSPSVAAAAPEPLVALRAVTCGYGDRVILSDLNLVVPRGQVVALMGTSGGGKTTVLRLIGRQPAGPLRSLSWAVASAGNGC